MSNAVYTLGPWMIMPERTKSGHIEIRSMDRIGGDIIGPMLYGNAVARIAGFGAFNTQDDPDARLIAAAPDLLEALKSWVAMENSANVSADKFEAVMKAAKAAIKKAEG